MSEIRENYCCGETFEIKDMAYRFDLKYFVSFAKLPFGVQEDGMLVDLILSESQYFNPTASSTVLIKSAGERNINNGIAAYI